MENKTDYNEQEWKELKSKREILADRNVVKANNPISIFKQDTPEDVKKEQEEDFLKNQKSIK